MPLQLNQTTGADSYLSSPATAEAAVCSADGVTDVVFNGSISTDVPSDAPLFIWHPNCTLAPDMAEHTFTVTCNGVSPADGGLVVEVTSLWGVDGELQEFGHGVDPHLQRVCSKAPGECNWCRWQT